MDNKTKLINPLFLSLQEQVVTENHIFSNKKDIFNHALTLACSFNYTKSEYKKSRDEVLALGKKVLNDAPGIGFVKEASLIYLLFVDDTGAAQPFKTFILENLDDILKSGISSNTKGLIGFCIRELQERKAEEYIEGITLLGQGELTAGRLNQAIDYLFGSAELTEPQSKELITQLGLHANDLSIERLAKGIMITARKSVTGISDLITMLEEKVHEDISTWKSSDIEFSIYEAHKLVNSNIPATHINQILKELKKVKTGWANMIGKIESEGVYVNLKNFNKVPNFSPNNDVWALLALQNTGRQYSYQLSQEQHEEFIELQRSKKKGFYSLEGYSIISLLVFSVFLTYWIYFLFATSGADVTSTFDLNILSASSLHDAALVLMNPWVEFVNAVFWLALLYNKLLKQGFLNLIDFVKTLPALYLFTAVYSGVTNSLKKDKNEG